MALFANRSAKAQPAVDLSRISQAASPVASSHLYVASTNDHRKAPRKGAWCVCSVKAINSESREGVILDVSATGARVRFDRRGTLPQQVTIKAGRIGLRRNARVVWQDLYDAGLEFTA